MAELATIRFLNVGQGDAAVISLDTGWNAMVDGGREHAIAPLKGYLRSTFMSIDLMVGTHFDADHLEGLAALVEAGLNVGRAILPPQVHPDGATAGAPSWAPGFGRSSRLLAAHFGAGTSIGEVYRTLDRRSAELFSRLERLFALEARHRRTLSARAAAVRAELAAASEIAHENELPNLARVMDAAHVSAASTESDTPDVRPVIQGSRALARELISAKSLKRLVDALNARRIPWVAPMALDRLAPMLGSDGRTAGVTITHVAPTGRFVHHYAREVSDVWSRVFEFMALARVSMPTLSNQLSHVLVFRDARHTVAFCGDSGFQGSRQIPDSLTSGWEEEFGQVDLLHLPHHGGRWGRFKDRVLPVLSTDPWRGLTLFGSVGFNRSNPPGPAAVHLLEDLAARRRFELYLANVPAGALGKYCLARGLSAREGPSILEFSAGTRWAATSVDASGSYSANPPVGLSVL